MKIKKEIITQAFEQLCESTTNKFWGLLTLFSSIEAPDKTIEEGITYRVNTDTLSQKLQILFYFGEQKTTFRKNDLYIRLSKYWIKSIKNQLLKGKPNLMDIVIFYYKDRIFSQKITSTELIKIFITELKITTSTLEQLFIFNNKENELIELEDNYDRLEVFKAIQKKINLNKKNQTLTVESPYSIVSHPSELQRAPFIQTLYSGTQIQELLLLTKFDLNDFYFPKKITQSATLPTPTNQIYYGAPGTGKSYTIKKRLENVAENQQERVTFHPEYDNTSFVGGYMPISEKDSEGEDRIKYKFVPQVFTNIYVKAWQNLEKPYYLVIEEINRGNCAEIFGEMFQLLDRTGGYSITPSQSLKKYLVETLVKTPQGIQNGKMQLPHNLHLLATMNTSDQSLFPMDSAFKRRWTWKYVPINEDTNVETNPSAAFFVRLDENRTFNWLEFILAVNKKFIRTNENLGADKCIGNYFIKPETDKISLEEFINKAIFYLWVDVFKEEIDTPFEMGAAYEDFFPENSNGIRQVELMLQKLGINID